MLKPALVGGTLVLVATQGTPRAMRTYGVTVWATVAAFAGLLSCALSPQHAPAVQPGGDAEYPLPADDWRGSAGEILSGAIQIRTVNPPGGEAALAEWLSLVLSGEPGIETRVVRLGSDEEAPRAAFWARVQGSGRARPIVLLSHLDTVPADPAGWTVDPFAGVIGGGFVVGRGALDAKGVTVAHLLTLVALARRDVPPARDVILLATPDEEAGGLHGAALIARDRRDLLGEAEFLLTEGGGILPGSPRRTPDASQPDIWGVAFTEKTPCWMDVVARGIPGHASAGGAAGAPEHLVAALAALRDLPTPIEVVPAVARMFASMAVVAPPDDREHFAQLRGALELNPEFRERFLADRGRAALVRNTAAVTTLDAGENMNVIPGEARATIDARLLPGASCSDFVADVREAVGPDIEVTVRLAFEAAESPVDTPLLAAIERVAERHTPRGVVVPRVIAGFTDAHWFRKLGITSYGFVPRRLRPIETRGVHGPNERVSLDNLQFGVDTLLEILDELDAGSRSR